MSDETGSATAAEAPEAPEPDAPTPAPEQPAQGDPPLDPATEAATNPAAAEPGADPPAASPAPEPESEPEPEPEPEQKDLSNLLESDEPEAATPRVRVSDNRSRVDRRERMRNYYARVYRPVENPSRLYFAARGAYALAGTTEGTGGGRMGFVKAEFGQTWNVIGYGVGATVLAGELTFGEDGVEKYGGLLVGGGPSLGLGRLGLFGRGYVDFRVGYNFFYAPISSTRPELADPPDAAPHGPKIQLDVGLLLHDSESRRFRHGLGASLGWQMLVHSFAGEYPRVNSFNVGLGYFFG